jgi:protein-L-isoaspartate(D-aspartate) O-methyltransferase
MLDPQLAAALLPDSGNRRVEMINAQVITRGVTDPDVIDAMRAIPREFFVPAGLREKAYEDSALPVGPGQTISQPFIVGYMTQSLLQGPMPIRRVLEIGTGTGYQAAILARLAEEVQTVEYDAALSAEAAARLRAMGIGNIFCHVGDGSAGWPSMAPYDRIMVTAGCPQIPQPLSDQLKDGGIMLIPVGDVESQNLLRVEKRGDRIMETPLLACRFVKLLGQYGWRG